MLFRSSNLTGSLKWGADRENTRDAERVRPFAIQFRMEVGFMTQTEKRMYSSRFSLQMESFQL